MEVVQVYADPGIGADDSAAPVLLRTHERNYQSLVESLLNRTFRRVDGTLLEHLYRSNTNIYRTDDSITKLECIDRVQLFFGLMQWEPTGRRPFFIWPEWADDEDATCPGLIAYLGMGFSLYVAFMRGLQALLSMTFNTVKLFTEFVPGYLEILTKIGMRSTDANNYLEILKMSVVHCSFRFCNGKTLAFTAWSFIMLFLGSLRLSSLLWRTMGRAVTSPIMSIERAWYFGDQVTRDIESPVGKWLVAHGLSLIGGGLVGLSLSLISVALTVYLDIILFPAVINLAVDIAPDALELIYKWMIYPFAKAGIGKLGGLFDLITLGGVLTLSRPFSGTHERTEESTLVLAGVSGLVMGLVALVNVYLVRLQLNMVFGFDGDRFHIPVMVPPSSRLGATGAASAAGGGSDDETAGPARGGSGARGSGSPFRVGAVGAGAGSQPGTPQGASGVSPSLLSVPPSRPNSVPPGGEHPQQKSPVHTNTPLGTPHPAGTIPAGTILDRLTAAWAREAAGSDGDFTTYGDGYMHREPANPDDEDDIGFTNHKRAESDDETDLEAAVGVPQGERVARGARSFSATK